ncbi:MAG TPA: histidine kinase [Gemmatimonadaceae bacterium]|jgi:hypothetical protein|nr:histidine kinase [Gemmatimonadaceae bacterium]
MNARDAVTSTGSDIPPKNRWVVPSVVIGLSALCALIEASQNYIGAINFGRPVPWSEAVRRTLPSWVIFALITPAVLFFARRFSVERIGWRRAVPIHFLGAAVFAVTHLGGTALYYGTRPGNLAPAGMLLTKYLTAYFVLDVLIYCGIVGATHAMHYYREAKARELAASRLQASLTEARLAALRGQLNPHFLFNTLNAVTTMALKREHENVVATLGYLSELLRVSLDERLPQEVSLADELELLDRYLEIQRIRFGDRLTITRDVDDDALGALVPIMILQPLAENAIVHGIAPVPGPGELRLRAARANGQLRLEVTDTGPGFGMRGQGAGNGAVGGAAPGERVSHSAGGIGLANTRERLAQLYGDESILELGDIPGGGASVSVTIPYRLAPSGVQARSVEASLP